MKIIIKDKEKLLKQLKYFSQLKIDQIEKILMLALEEHNYLDVEKNDYLYEPESGEYIFYFENVSWLEPEENGIYVKCYFSNKIEFGFMFRDFNCCKVKWNHIIEKGKEICDYDFIYLKKLTAKYNILMSGWFGREYIIYLLHARFPYEFSSKYLLGLDDEFLNFIFEDRINRMLKDDESLITIYKIVPYIDEKECMVMKPFNYIVDELFRKICKLSKSGECFDLYIRDEFKNNVPLIFSFNFKKCDKYTDILVQFNGSYLQFSLGEKENKYKKKWDEKRESILKFFSRYIPHEKFYCFEYL